MSTPDGVTRNAQLAAVLASVEAERVRLADALNTEPVQTLAHMSRILRGIEDEPGTPPSVRRAAAQAGLLASDMSRRLRAIARDLRPTILDDLGISAALRQLGADFRVTTELPLIVQIAEVPRPRPPELEVVLFRVAQEALRNAEVHAAATEISLRLWRRGSHIVMSISDNGIGVDPRALVDGPRTGLRQMQARLRSVGGRLAVRAASAGGTVVIASVPVTPKSL